MTPHDLRDALRDTTVPPLPVADDLWRRGRRRRRRDHRVALGAAVLLLAGVASAVVGVRGEPRADIAGTGDRPALPSRIVLPQYGDRVPAAPDLAVGVQAAVAVRTDLDESAGGTGIAAIGIDATTGAYRTLALPDFGTPTGDLAGASRPIALSPDGRRLAYPSTRREGYRSPVTAIAVVDLVTGRLDRFRLRDDDLPILLNTVGWSPDGRRLVWTGQRASGGSFADRLSIGTLQPGTGAPSRVLPVHPSAAAASIADDGTVALASLVGPAGVRVVAPDGTGTTLSRRASIAPYATCTDGADVAVSGRRGPRDRSAVRLLREGREEPVTIGAELADTTWEVLACRDATTAVALVAPPAGTSSYRLGLATLQNGVARFDDRSSSVRLADGKVYGQLAVAADLLDTPAADRPLPPWAVDTPWWRSGRIMGVGLVVALVLGGLVVRRRRTG